MASGCPVINAAIPHSGVPWVSRHEESGLTVPVDDPAAFAAAARRLLDEPALRDRLAAGARARAVAEFDRAAMGRRSLAFYGVALSAAPHVPPSPRREPRMNATRERATPTDAAPDEGRRAGRSVTTLHVYSGNLYGGIETLLATLARGADLAPAMRPEFALCFPGRLRDELLAAGAIVHDLGPVRFRHPWTILRARRRLARVLADRRPDVVVAHAFWPHALFAPIAIRRGLPVVLWQHDFAGSGHWVERLASRARPDLILSNSGASAATLPALFPGVASEVIYYPVLAAPRPLDPAGERAATRRDLGAGPGSVVVIQACRMERWKGHTLLLDALQRLRDHPDWVAWIVGGAQRPHEREYLRELEALAASAGIADRVRFLGQRSDVPRLLAAADVHCQPNTGPEPFGIAFIEALYAGLPVVSTRMGGAAEIVTPECGVLVDPGDADALADALSRLFADSAGRARLGGSGPARARELSDPARVMARLCGLASGLVASDGANSTAPR